MILRAFPWNNAGISRQNRGNVVPMMIALKAATPQLPRTTAVADHVVAVDETDSTNALAVQMIGDGSLTLPDHQDGELAVAVVAADRQTAGRGRNGHKWVSQPGRCSTMSYAVRIPRAIATDESVNGWLQMIAGLVTLDARIPRRRRRTSRFAGTRRARTASYSESPRIRQGQQNRSRPPAGNRHRDTLPQVGKLRRQVDTHRFIPRRASYHFDRTPFFFGASRKSVNAYSKAD